MATDYERQNNLSSIMTRGDRRSGIAVVRILFRCSTVSDNAVPGPSLARHLCRFNAYWHGHNEAA